MATERVLYERRLEKIFDMLLLGMTNEEIADHLQITVRAVQNYKRKLEDRYMKYQQQKNENTWALEFNLLKNRLLTLYRNLDRKIADSRTSTADAARAVDVASHLALTIHNAELEGLRAIREMANMVNSVSELGGVGKEGGRIVGYRHPKTIWRQGEGGEFEAIPVGNPIPITHYDVDGPVTIHWSQLNDEQKQMLNPERYKGDQNRKF
jgi:hypothetical protein